MTRKLGRGSWDEEAGTRKLGRGSWDEEAGSSAKGTSHVKVVVKRGTRTVAKTYGGMDIRPYTAPQPSEG